MIATPLAKILSPEPTDLPAPSGPQSMLDLMSDGFYMLLLIKRGHLPSDKEGFKTAVLKFVRLTERRAAQHGIAAEDIDAAIYAFCASVDEVILSSPPSPVRDQWQLKPLQLYLYGDQLAGDRFFAKLEELRAFGTRKLGVIEVYYLCLLLGFHGKYRIQGEEKLGFLVARLGEEITYLKDRRTSFAPHWAPPDRVSHRLRRYVPLWVPALVLGVIGLTSYSGFRLSLDNQTQSQLAGYHQLIQMPARTAHLKITLP